MTRGNEKGVYQLENGNWAYRFVINVDGKYKTQRRSKGEDGKPFKTQKQAAKAREKALLEAKVEVILPSSNRPIERKRIREVYEEYCATGRTGKAYATIIKQDKLWNNHLLDRFGSKYVDTVRVADVEDYLAELYCVRNYAYSCVEGFLKQYLDRLTLETICLLISIINCV